MGKNYDRAPSAASRVIRICDFKKRFMLKGWEDQPIVCQFQKNKKNICEGAGGSCYLQCLGSSDNGFSHLARGEMGGKQIK